MIVKKNKIIKGIVVKIITGDDKGKSGKILEINRKKNLVKVQGIALVTKHYKARKKDEKSEIKIFERFIHISNVEYLSAA